MKRDKKNEKVEYHLNQCEDLLDRCYCSRPKNTEERRKIFEGESFFSKAIYHADRAEKIIHDLNESNAKKEYELRMKSLACKTLNFGSETLMVLAGESAKRGVVEETMKYVEKASEMQEVAKTYGKALEIETVEIENLKRVCFGMPPVHNDDLEHNVTFQGGIQDFLGTLVPPEAVEIITKAINEQLEQAGENPFIGILQITFEKEDEEKR